MSPVLAEAAMEGRLPRGFCVKRLTDLPMLWSEQWRAVGLQQPIQAQAEPRRSSVGVLFGSGLAPLSAFRVALAGGLKSAPLVQDERPLFHYNLT